MVCHAREVSITILHTTDLHANILPMTDYKGTPDMGGLARCASMIKKIRSEEKNVLLVDAGDLYQGNAIGYRTKGSVMVRAVNMLRYDAWTLGNHEFDWGIDKVAARIAQAQVPVLAANLHYHPAGSTPSDITESFGKIQPYIIREVDGVKVGIVGLTTPGIPNWSRPRLIPGITLENSVPSLKRVIPQMKALGCEILVLVTHQGLRESGDNHANELNAVSSAFPELDVIIGGHSHQLRKQQSIRGILYTQANYWGTYLGRVDLIYDTKKQKLASKKADPILMDSSVNMDSELLALLRSDLDETTKFLNARIGETAEPLYSLTGPKKETPVFNLFCSAIAEAIRLRGGEVDGVLHGIWNERMTLEPGPITMRDIFELVPYENTIGVALLTKNQLLDILEENVTAYQTSQFRGLWGLTMRLGLSEPRGKQIVFLGNESAVSLDPKSLVRVAFNSFDLASGGDRWRKLREIVDQPAVQLKEYDFQTRDAVVEYIQKHSPLKVELHGWWSLERSGASRKTDKP